MRHYVLENPEGDYALTEGQANYVRQQFNDAMSAGTDPRLIVIPPGCTLRPLDSTASSDQITKLTLLLGLSEQERQFVHAALDPATPRDFWAVLADYLEERQNPNADRWRNMAAEQVTLDVGYPEEAPGALAAAVKVGRRAIIDVSDELLIAALGLPPETRVVRAGHNIAHRVDTLSLDLTHPDFPEVCNGDIIPTASPQFQRSETLHPRAEFVGWGLPE